MFEKLINYYYLNADDSLAEREEIAPFEASSEPTLNGDDAGKNCLVQPVVEFRLFWFAQEDLLVSNLKVLRVEMHWA